jgi:hypothetical protein
MESVTQEYIGTVSNGVVVLPSDNQLQEGTAVRVVPVNGLDAQKAALKPRQPGSAIGKLIIHADDDEHLKDFQEYMP